MADQRHPYGAAAGRRILNYGSDEHGQQTGALLYDIWDPTLGTGMTQSLLPNTHIDTIFCGNSSVQ